MNRIDEITREFYGQYGYAMHTAQMLERGLLELYALKKFLANNLTEIEYYSILSNPKKWTLGGIIREIVIYNCFDHHYSKMLENANDNRIFLAHMFWWERDIKFNDGNELVKLHKEIFSYIDIFNQLIQFVDLLIKKVREENNLNIEQKMGLTNFEDRESFIKSLKIKSNIK
jgi:hypothetical protein